MFNQAKPFNVSTNSMEAFSRAAEEMKARRRVSSPKVELPVARVEHPKVETKSLAEVAAEIQAKRVERTKTLALPKIEAPTKFICTRKSGESIELYPTLHAVDQFRWRYFILDRSFNYRDESKLIATMIQVFSQGERVSNEIYQKRSQMRNAPVSAMVWGTRTMKFIIDPVSNSIITCELSGKYKKFNRSHFKDKIEAGTFDHNLMHI